MASMAVADSSVALGTELDELHFESVADWLVRWHDPVTLWQNHPTSVLAAASYLLGGLLTLTHALASGGRWPFLWFAALFHGMVVECMCYYVPDAHNFWHAQTPVMMLGRRLPLHIVFLYPCFIYHGAVAVFKLRLPRWAEPFAVGLAVVLVDIPYDIVCVKFLHWTWHDTDPNIADRHYWVPWNSYYFHATFACAFTFWFHSCRDGAKRWQRRSVGTEVRNSVLAALLGTPFGALMFLPLYHPLHDMYGVHSEVTFFALLSVFLGIAWAGSRSASPTPTATKATAEGVASWRAWLLPVHLLVHYALWTAMVAVGQPEREASTGLHEQIGDCEAVEPLRTISGLVLQKRKFLCTSDYDEAYFDFHCLPGGEPPADGALWYTACGTPFQNRAEYLLVVLAIDVAAFLFFWVAHFRSGPEAEVGVAAYPGGLAKARKAKAS